MDWLDLDQLHRLSLLGALIFELSPHFEEVLVEGDEPLKPHTFSPYDGSSGNPSKLEKNELNQTLTYEDFGFRLSSRVPPRYFKGVLFNMHRKLEKEEYEQKIKNLLEKNRDNEHALQYEKDEDWLRQQEEYKYVEETRIEQLTERARNIALEMMSANEEKPELLIPVYDIHGNLWWPKQASHEEIKNL